MIRLFLAAALLQAGMASAQQPVLQPSDVSRIADAVVDTLLPPGSKLSTMTVRDRGIVFDAGRTDAALRRVPTSIATPASLRMRSTVENGSATLLDDCRNIGSVRGECTKLGNRAYVWLDSGEPLSNDSLRVWARVVWPGRPTADRVGKTGRRLIGFSQEVIMVRASSGAWRVARLGRVAAS